MASFDYLVCVDFQVTGGEEITKAMEQEVIEFPWIVIDVASKQIVDEKQVFIKPTVHPTLADDTIKDTGIAQPMVDSANTLQAVVQEFNDYVYRSFIANNKDFCLVVDGEHVLKRWLRADCKRKEIKLAAHFSKFVDLRLSFKDMYEKWAGASTVMAMAERLDVPMNRTVKGGLEFCKAMAGIVTRMLNDGGKLSKTMTIPDTYDPLADPVYQPGGPKHNDRERFVKAEILEGSFIVKCRGMPYAATEQDIRSFFEGCKIAEVLLVMNSAGRASGEGFVKFETKEDGAKALMRDRDLMIKRYVEVYASNDTDMQNAKEKKTVPAAPPALAAAVSASDHYKGVCKMRGLPYTVSFEEIRNFFKECTIAQDGIVLCQARDGRNNGEAYIEFAQESDIENAIKQDRQYVGSRYVEVHRSSKQELNQYLARIRASKGVSAGGADYFIKMRGLPFTARERDVMEFFARVSVTPVGVSLVYNNRDQPNGEAFVEFGNGEDLQKAIGLNKDCVGHRYVELFRSSRTEATQVLGMGGGGGGGGGMPAMGFMNPQMMQGMAAMMQQMGGMAGMQQQMQMMQQAFAQGQGAPSPMPPAMYPPQPGPQPPAPYGHAAPSPYAAGAAAADPYQQAYGGIGPQAGPPGMNPAAFAAGAPMGGMGGMGNPTVKIRGLPWRATTQDLVQFFQGYSFMPESIQFDVGGDGRPNGQAFVTFASVDEAHRAIRERNKQYVGNRFVELYSAV